MTNFAEAETTEIITRIDERVGAEHRCPVCGQSGTYQVVDGFAFLVTHHTTRALTNSGTGVPCVLLVCANCGNTHFLNMLSLGLKHLVDRP